MLDDGLTLSAGSPAVQAVISLEWSPDCHALGVGYDVCGIGVWSVFGSCLLRPLQDSDASRSLTPLGSRGLSWSAEGYRLLSIPRSGVPGFAPSCLYYQSFVKSSLTACPTSSNQATVLLQGEDRIYINPDSNSGLASSIEKLCDTQWQVIPLPPAFHMACWPLRFAAVDTTGVNIAVAGVCGERERGMRVRMVYSNMRPRQKMSADRPSTTHTHTHTHTHIHTHTHTPHTHTHTHTHTPHTHTHTHRMHDLKKHPFLFLLSSLFIIHLDTDLCIFTLSFLLFYFLLHPNSLFISLSSFYHSLYPYILLKV